MDEQKELCIFRKSFLDDRTTFSGYSRWSQSHPLYPCAYLCQGYDEYCIGYKPIKKLEDIEEKVNQ